ncbi:MAG: hypothetical protein WC862_05270 [Patescibacteria group bacterium]
MITPLYIFAAITAIFIAILIVKKITRSQICAICAGVSLTWIALLAGHWLGWLAIDPLLIAVLMGQSVVGLYYLLERKFAERWGLFRLPFLLSCTFATYLLLGYHGGFLGAVIFVAALWTMFGLLFLFRGSPRWQKIAKQIAACCKNW